MIRQGRAKVGGDEDTWLWHAAIDSWPIAAQGHSSDCKRLGLEQMTFAFVTSQGRRATGCNLVT